MIHTDLLNNFKWNGCTSVALRFGFKSFLPESISDNRIVQEWALTLNSLLNDFLRPKIFFHHYNSDQHSIDQMKEMLKLFNVMCTSIFGPHMLVLDCIKLSLKSWPSSLLNLRQGKNIEQIHEVKGVVLHKSFIRFSSFSFFVCFSYQNKSQG